LRYNPGLPGRRAGLGQVAVRESDVGTSSVRKGKKPPAGRGRAAKQVSKAATAPGGAKAADICKELGIQSYVLKFWESEFPQLGKRLDEKRVYDAEAVEIAREIHRLIDLERCSLVEARRTIDDSHPKEAGATSDDEAIAESASIVAALRRELQDSNRRIVLLEREKADLERHAGRAPAGAPAPAELDACLEEARALAREADELVRELLDAAAAPSEADAPKAPSSERLHDGLFPPDS